MSRPSATSQVALLVLSLGTVASCQSEARNSGAAPVASTTSGAVAATADSAHTAMGGMHEDALAPKVQAHLRRLNTPNPDSLKALVPIDREVVTALIADCEQMMSAMKMDPPRKWRNAVHDLRQDLDRMAGMSGAQLRSAMPGHRERIQGMLTMRHDMMHM
ncbi:MAG: hypothetical protein NVS4B3_01440 [Gemmatimonadaceae bacterium]